MQSADPIPGLLANGSIAKALEAAAKLDDALRKRVVGQAVDAAIAQRARDQLPAELQAGYDQIVAAFKHYEANNDDGAREALQAIGLQSPFLEWKVLLRGLIAYQANDDARALENWQRLDPVRLPARLCVALRAGIDRAFLEAQAPAVQQSLKTSAIEPALATQLKALRALMTKKTLAQAFRKAEPIVATLRKEHPGLAQRLANCFFWTIIERGQPEDIERHLRVFGPPADDPALHRLEALALESRAMWPEAHEAWKKLLAVIEAHPDHWAGDAHRRVQAIIWARMAANAAHAEEQTQEPDFLSFVLHGPTQPLKPGAEQCYEKSIKLAPERLETYRELFRLLLDTDKTAKAKKVGAELLKRFPSDAETLEMLGDLAMDEKAYKKGLEHYEKAIEANSLDRNLRNKVADACVNLGLEHAVKKQYAKARELFEQAVPLWTGPMTSLLCLRAATELKAGESDRARAFIAQAEAAPDHRLACRYALVGASVRVELPAKDKKRIAEELKAAFAEKPTPAEILVLMEMAAHQRHAHDEAFHGQKTQEKTILKFLNGIDFNAFDEKQLQRLCGCLASLDARKPLLACLQHARRKHLRNPYFRLALAAYYLDAPQPQPHLAREHLDVARRLVEALPRGEVQNIMFEKIKAIEEVVVRLSAPPSLLGPFDEMFDDLPFDDLDDFEDDP